jgi:hypothetical protein
MYMKGLLQRFTQWYNRKHGRSGGLWEDAFKSVLVEDGVASRTMAAWKQHRRGFPLRTSCIEMSLIR